MTAKEMSNEFDILYDTASQEAPGLDEYEKSVFLTKGMLELTEQRHREYLGRASRGFHDDELNRDALKGFVASAVVEFQETPVVSDKFKSVTSESKAGYTYSKTDLLNLKVEHTVAGSAFFKRPKDSMGVLYEDVTLTPVVTNNPLYNKRLENRVKGVRTSVTPVRYDHVTRLLKNPFTKPTPDVAFRLDHSDYDGASMSEIICDNRYTPAKYRVKYIKIPYPIILVDLTSEASEFYGQGLSVDGETKPYEEPRRIASSSSEEPAVRYDPKGNVIEPDKTFLLGATDKTHISQATNVDMTIHHEIVQRGVELAILHYRENTLQNNMQAKIK